MHWNSQSGQHATLLELTLDKFLRLSPGTRRTPWRRSGFTLIELMVTIAIIAIMMALAAPSFVTYQRNSQLTRTANSFLGALSAARAEAMKRQLNTYVVPLNGSDWTQGWMVFVDTNWNATYDDGTDILVSKQDPIPTAVTVASGGDTTMSNGSAKYVMYSGDGAVHQISGVYAPTSTPPTLKFYNGTDYRLVIASPSGRLRVCVPDSTTCTPSDPL